MAKWMNTLKLGEDKKFLERDKNSLAERLTSSGNGKTHYVAIEQRKGQWMISLYKR